MTGRTLDRWLGYGVLVVIALTAAGVWCARGVAGRPPVLYTDKHAAVAFTYREVAARSFRLQHARAIAVYQQTIYVVGNRALQTVYLRNGARGRSVVLDGQPTAVTVGRDGMLYIGMSDHVEVWNSGLTRKATWVARPKMHLTGLAAGAHTVWVADAGNKLVVGYDFTGKVIATLGAKDAGNSLLTPGGQLDVAVTPCGEIAVTNPGRHRVDFYDTGGKLLRSRGMASSEAGGFSGCCNPVSITAVTPNDLITAEKGLRRLQRFTSAGAATVIAPLPAGSAWDLATFDDGKILVLDPTAKCVRVYEMDPQ